MDETQLDRIDSSKGFSYSVSSNVINIIRTIPSLYHYLLKNGICIQVESAIRDGSGRKIETKYIRTVNDQIPVNGNIDIIIPTKLSELENDSGFLTQHQSLSNYYDKIQINSMLGNISDML